MGFFSERCPNCSKHISKNADYCRECGCPTATTWSTCHSCAASVGSDSRFCWKCGSEQQPDLRKAFYGDRWHRSATSFAAKVDLNTPEQALHHGLQVDEGTVALLFQNGHFKGLLPPGYHSFDNFLQRLTGFDKGAFAHAVLIDTQSAEVDFQVEDIRVEGQVPIDVRVRLLFRVTDPHLFAQKFVSESTPSFTTEDLAARFRQDVKDGLQLILAKQKPDDLMTELRIRELLEAELMSYLEGILAAYGLKPDGIRFADFGGEAIAYIREKLGDISRMNREAEVNRQLRDALRQEKVGAFRDEEQLKEYYEQVTHEFGLKGFEREQDKKLFVQGAEHRERLEGLRQDYEARRSEILNRLDEQKITHESEIISVRAEVERGAVRFEEDIRQQKVRFGVGQEQSVSQAKTDLEVARQGIQALREVKETKLDLRMKEESVDLETEKAKLKMRGDASLQALLATLNGEQADRLMKFAELEMRKGLSPEQAMALFAEKSPEIAPAVADALKAKYSSPENAQ
jgi:hypothetical protein